MLSANLGAVGRRACIATTLALAICSTPVHAVSVDGNLADLIATVNTLQSSGTIYNWAKGSDPLGINDTPVTESGNGSDIKDMFAHYDPVLDILYLGMNVWGNVGTSGDLEGTIGGQAGVFDYLESYGFDIRFPANSSTQVVRFDVLGEELHADLFCAPNCAPAQGSFSTNPYNLTVGWAVSVADNGVEFSVAGLATAGVFGLPYPNWPAEITLSFYAGSATNDGAEDMAQMNMQVVPVPAAVWLLGSGLLGLIAAARRKG